MRGNDEAKIKESRRRRQPCYPRKTAKTWEPTNTKQLQTGVLERTDPKRG